MRAGRMTDGDDVPTPNAIDWRLETVFGRSAMTGMAMLPTEEILGGGDALGRVFGEDFIRVALVVVLIAWASTQPFEFNPQCEYEANPESLRGKTGISGFLAYEKLNLNVDVERANGRAAMVGFAVVVALESLVLHHGLFAR